jgi:formylglycine-generating enzyme required for sulfatase activity
MSVIGCSKKDQPETQQAAPSVEPTPDRLPAALRKRLDQAQQRIKTLETQREILSTKLDQLITMGEKYSSSDREGKAQREAQKLISQTKRQLQLVDDSLSRLNDLVARVKLQAVADEAQVDPISSDQELTSALQDAVDVYGELGELESVQREAALGQLEAQFKLAQRYEKGAGVDQSDVEALKWYTKAAQQKHVEAALIVGFFHKHGRGTQPNIKRAIKWYTQAAHGGNLIAASNLGRLLSTPPASSKVKSTASSDASTGSDETSTTSTQGSPKTIYNLSEAIRWYQVAADGGVSGAQLRLAQLYLSTKLQDQLGKHAPQDLSERYADARRLLVRASKSKRAKVSAKAKELLGQFTQKYSPKMAELVKASLHLVTLEPGEFMMGDSERYPDAKPQRKVKVDAFSLSSSEITVTQYKQCTYAGVCTKPSLDKRGCNFREVKRSDHPINCISWGQARTFARWVGGDLPSEAQWEFAARSGGKYARYPWGEEAPTCERAVMRDSPMKSKRRQRGRRAQKQRKSQKNQGKGCGKGYTWDVCSRPQGLSVQGACDLVGNLWEWTLDEYRPSYDDAPNDGAARCANSDCEAAERVMRSIRGGGYMTGQGGATATKRSQSNRPAIGIGFRVAL